MGKLGENSTFSSVIAAISDPIVGIDEAGHIELWNDAAVESFGYSKVEAEGEKVTELFSLSRPETERLEELLNLIDPTTWQVFDSDPIELTVTKARGAKATFEFRPLKRQFDMLVCIAEPVADQQPEMVTIGGEESEIFRQAIEDSTDMLAAADRNERFLFANDRYRQFHGIEPPVKGKSLRSVLPLDTYSGIKSQIQQVLDGEQLNFTMERQGPDGNLRYLNLKYYPLRSEAGSVIGAVSSIRDITELEQRGTALRKAWESYRDLVQGIPDPIVLFDLDGAVLEVNKAAVRGLEYSESELKELSYDELVYDDWVDWIDSQLETKDTNHVAFEAQYRPQSSESFPVEVVSTRTDYFGNEAILTVARDLTDRKEYEHQLQVANARLEEFAAVVTQDLRNPLTVARGWAEMVESSEPSKPISKIRAALDRMENIIDYTYTLAHKETFIDTVKTVDLGRIVRQCWNAIETDGATLEIERGCSVQGDRDRLSQLFETLFENTITHSNPPSEIRVGTLDNSRGFYVINDGPEIPKKDRKHSVRTAHIGTPNESVYDIPALKRIANAHGWHLRLAKSEWGGARFEFHGVETCTATGE